MSDILVETTKLSEKGQVVIPKEFRKKMGLKTGNQFLVIAAQEAIILQRIEIVKRKLKVEEVLDIAKNVTQELSP
ncbi:MAG: AbrB/MazE/SpoVT family DNA-binding domain-containing protein [Nitrososphaerales archaeon]|nr:AbrB/MazE/SpoVT family DNA-binding domain-containing protein [Nitrososphaerales archaeon]HJN57397.1 AbrB/MazE/SpoVT family DNA-binding domain-containing protein [Nitrososphaerales archaeon]